MYYLKLTHIQSDSDQWLSRTRPTGDLVFQKVYMHGIKFKFGFNRYALKTTYLIALKHKNPPNKWNVLWILYSDGSSISSLYITFILYCSAASGTMLHEAVYYKKSNARIINNHITFVTIHYVSSYEWWRCELIWTHHFFFHHSQLFT